MNCTLDESLNVFVAIVSNEVTCVYRRLSRKLREFFKLNRKLLVSNKLKLHNGPNELFEERDMLTLA